MLDILKTKIDTYKELLARKKNTQAQHTFGQVFILRILEIKMFNH